MANRTTYGLKHRKTEVEWVTFELKGAGAGAPTINDATQPGGSDCLSTAYASTGTWSAKVRRAYPQVIDCWAHTFGSTAGLKARVTAKPSLLTAGGTISLVTEVGSVATDPASGDTIIVHILVRNSGRN